MNGTKVEKDIGESAAILWLANREKKREESGLNALMDKFDAARKSGLDLNEADKTRLLALLLDNVLAGLGNYEGKVFGS